MGWTGLIIAIVIFLISLGLAILFMFLGKAEKNDTYSGVSAGLYVLAGLSFLAGLVAIKNIIESANKEDEPTVDYSKVPDYNQVYAPVEREYKIPRNEIQV